MLTPIEIQSKVLKSGMGYSKKETDLFLDEILQNYQELYNQNLEMKDKVSVLSEGVQYYKNIEKTLQKALVLAEKTAAETKETAQLNASAIENDAKANAKIIVADAKNELDRIHTQTISMIQQYDKYKAQYKQLAATQIELLNSESFQIHIADLDAFSETPEEKKETEYQEEPFFDTSEFVPEINKSEEKNISEDEDIFEFLNEQD